MTPTLSQRLADAGSLWKLAMILLLASPLSWVAMPAAAPWPGCGLLLAAALLALTSTLIARAASAAPAANAAVADLVQALAALLEEQRNRMQDATATASRAVTAGVQLVSLARGAEQQWRRMLEQPVPPPEPPAATGSEQWSAFHDSQAGLQLRVEAIAERLDALLQQVAEQRAAVPAPVLPAELPASLLRLEKAVQILGRITTSQACQEASLGDAARYLTETADRLRDGVQAVETHAVRLQALLMAQRAAEAGSPVPDHRTADKPNGGAVPSLLQRLQQPPHGTDTSAA